MNKKLGGVMLVSGTCIGSGMIALPIVLAKLGLVPSLIIMLITWWLIYYTSLVNLELNLHSGKGSTLAELGLKFSGKVAELLGMGSINILSYALLSVYIYGGSSVLQKMLNIESFHSVASCYSLVSMLLLLCPIRIIDYVNRILFISLIGVIALMIIGLLSTIDMLQLPLFTENYSKISTWSAAVPVLFTAFGFQVIFHTLTNYCNKEPELLKKVFFWGSLFPAVIYIIWTFSILGAIYSKSPVFYQKMLTGDVIIGELIKELSLVSSLGFVQSLVWWITLLTIVTSILGVGLGLFDTIKVKILSESKNNIYHRLIVAFLTIFPAYVIAILIPNAFISVLGFAGMILVFIAVFLPIYLFRKGNFSTIFYKQLKNNILIYIALIIGAIIVICELINIL
jgi:tyrosine-specific transport protein